MDSNLGKDVALAWWNILELFYAIGIFSALGLILLGVGRMYKIRNLVIIGSSMLVVVFVACLGMIIGTRL